MYRRVRYLGAALIMLLGLYPIAELTRVIVVSGTYYFPDMDWQFTAEITIMWILYLSIIPTFLLFNSRSLRHLRKSRRPLSKQNEAKTNMDFSAETKPNYIPVKYIR